MILLFTSAGEEVYKQFVLQVLCYPSQFILTDIPYRLKRVDRPYDLSPAELTNQDAAIVLVDYVESDGPNATIEPIFLPLRMATIVRASRFAGKLLLDVRLGKFPYYDDDTRKGYEIPNAPLSPPRLWNHVIKANTNAPHPKERTPGVPIDPKNRDSWVSSGKFVLNISKGLLDFEVIDSRGEARIQAECEDWKSVIDMATSRRQLEDKLFYQICDLKKSDSEENVQVQTIGRRSVYEISAGDSAELALHFYQPERPPTGKKRVLKITTDDKYLGNLGKIAIDVFPQQISGKIEHLRLIVKKQLSQEFTRVSINEGDTDLPALATTELYLVIRPRRFFVGAILIAFALGVLLNALPEHVLPWFWVWKVLGSILMAGAFWLAFSKFPSKD